jgi:hypothetical protein
VVTDLAEVRRLAEAKAGENRDFLRWVHQHHHSDHEFHIIAARVEQAIDCTQCANCCRETRVEVSPEEIRVLAVHVREPEQDAVRQFTEPDGSGPGRVLRQVGGACVFLDREGLCMVYEARPRPCREFPCVSSDAASLGGRLESVFRTAWLCPIAYNAIEEYKHALGYRGAGGH